MIADGRILRLTLCAVAATALVVSACGDGRTSGQPGGVTINVVGSDPPAQPAGGAEGLRTGEGIAAAGGTVVASGEPCPQPGTAGAGEVVTIAMVSHDVFNLDFVGLSDLVFEQPNRILDAYVNQVNSYGGLGGRCFEASSHTLGFADPVADIERICADLEQRKPLVLFSIGVYEPIESIDQCAVRGAGIPVIGLFSEYPADALADAGGLLRVDHGSVEFLVANAVESAAAAGVLTSADRLVLLHRTAASAMDMTDPAHQMTDMSEPGHDMPGMEQMPGTGQQAHQMTTGDAHLFGGHVHDPNQPGIAAFDAATERLNLQVTGWLGVVPDFSGTAVLNLMDRFEGVGGDLFDADEGSFQQASALLPPDQEQTLTAMRSHFVQTAQQMSDVGVTAVVATSDWNDVRNLMRAAELVGWHPKWIVSDAHDAMLVLTGTPPAQGANLVMMSVRRAADDPVDGLDRGCLGLRNSWIVAGPFVHRYHSDAWNLMMSICDYLDVTFGAISRVDGPLSTESFLEALNRTDYVTSHGQRLRFSADDLFGSDSFRLLQADPTCALNSWGCMRATTTWFDPPVTAAGSRELPAMAPNDGMGGQEGMEGHGGHN